MVKGVAYLFRTLPHKSGRFPAFLYCSDTVRLRPTHDTGIMRWNDLDKKMERKKRYSVRSNFCSDEHTTIPLPEPYAGVGSTTNALHPGRGKKLVHWCQNCFLQ